MITRVVIALIKGETSEKMTPGMTPQETLPSKVITINTAVRGNLYLVNQVGVK